MNKYENLLASLSRTGAGTMKCFGSSMLPLLSNPCVNDYKAQEAYAVGDIVFCKVRGRFIDAHLVTAADGERYLISNNHGHNNGWTRTVYGRVVRSVDLAGREKRF